MTAREYLNAIDARANAATPDDLARDLFAAVSLADGWTGTHRNGTAIVRTLLRWGWEKRPSRQDVPALTAALRAILDLCDQAERKYAPAAPVHLIVSASDVRAAVESALGGAK